MWALEVAATTALVLDFVERRALGVVLVGMAALEAAHVEMMALGVVLVEMVAQGLYFNIFAMENP